MPPRIIIRAFGGEAPGYMTRAFGGEAPGYMTRAFGGEAPGLTSSQLTLHLYYTAKSRKVNFNVLQNELIPSVDSAIILDHT